MYPVDKLGSTLQLVLIESPTHLATLPRKLGLRNVRAAFSAIGREQYRGIDGMRRPGVTTQVLYTPDSRELDLANLSSSDYALICSLHQKIHQGDRVLLRLMPSTAGHDEMFIQKRREKYYAVHFSGGGHRHEVSFESDEHKRQKEYWHPAVTDAGRRHCGR